MSPSQDRIAISSPLPQPSFLFAVCQVGAEPVLKGEINHQWPGTRLAFSRPGFVTFKLPSDWNQPADFDLKSVFARTYGYSLGKCSGTDGLVLARRVWELVGDSVDFRHLHVWQRDRAIPGDFQFEPGVTALAESVGELIAAARPRAERPLAINKVVRTGQLVLDCVLVEPYEWWIGYHEAALLSSRWPGGVVGRAPAEARISRAYLKMNEALEWSRLPIQTGDLCAELGAAPGGSCQALLDRGAHVLGIDPAEMDPEVLAHPSFRHLRKRTADVKRREFAAVKWLAADLNVAPKFTLDAVEEIIGYPSVQIRGLLLTLKLADWALAAEIPSYLERIRRWGYGYVRARQLAHNRQEICVLAMKDRSTRREPRRRPHQSAL